MKKLLILSLLFSGALTFAMEQDPLSAKYDEQLLSFNPPLNCLQSCAVNTMRVMGVFAPLAAVAARGLWGEYMDDDYIRLSAVLSLPIVYLAIPFSINFGERLSLLLAAKWYSSEYDDHVASCKKAYEEEREAR